jgi:hypothetical protein
MLSYSWAWLPAIVIVGAAVLAIPYLAFPIFLLLLSLPVLLIWGGEFLAHDPPKRSARRNGTGSSGPVAPTTRSPTIRTRTKPATSRVEAARVEHA